MLNAQIQKSIAVRGAMLQHCGTWSNASALLDAWSNASALLD
jgi:hypothetical protein